MSVRFLLNPLILSIEFLFKASLRLKSRANKMLNLHLLNVKRQPEWSFFFVFVYQLNFEQQHSTFISIDIITNRLITNDIHRKS